MFRKTMLLTVAVALSASTAQAESKFGLQEGSPGLKSAGALAFGPEGILFVADAKQATVYALDTQDTQGDPSGTKYEIKGLNKAVADMLGVTTREVAINDLAVNPKSGNLYLSVSLIQPPWITCLCPITLKALPSAMWKTLSMEQITAEVLESLPNSEFSISDSFAMTSFSAFS